MTARAEFRVRWPHCLRGATLRIDRERGRNKDRLGWELRNGRGTFGMSTRCGCRRFRRGQLRLQTSYFGLRVIDGALAAMRQERQYRYRTASR